MVTVTNPEIRMEEDAYARAKAALQGIDANVQLGLAIDRAGKRVVRVNVGSEAPDRLISLLHERLEKIPHEIRRVRAARLEV